MSVTPQFNSSGPAATPGALDAVLSVAREGGRVFPVVARAKNPLLAEWQQQATTDEATIQAWAARYPGCNWGMACGTASGVWVLDVDGPQGEQWYRENVVTRGDDKTRRVKTAKGFHLYYQCPSNGTAIRNTVGKIAPGIDVRGEGGFVLIPPSIHPDGIAYERVGVSSTIEYASDYLTQSATAASRSATLATGSTVVGSGSIQLGLRNSTLASEAGRLRRKGAGVKAINTKLQKLNVESCDPPLPVAEVATIAASIARYAPAKDDNLLRSDNGRLLPVIANALTMLRESPEWKGVLGFDDFSRRIMLLNPAPGFQYSELPRAWTDEDNVSALEWLQRQGLMLPTAHAAGQAIQNVARQNRFHPVRDYLEGLTWDRVARLDSWLPRCLGCEDTPYSRAVSACVAVGAVARIFQPGCKHDCLLVLIGEQGILKSTALRELFSPRWFSDHISDLGNKDSRLELLGRWCIEMAELSAVRRSDIERVKNFISSPVDVYRAPYAAIASEHPRQTVFCATTNDDTPFTDATGSRRFWPIRCGQIDVTTVRAERDQLWAEAVERYRAGANWWLAPELEQIAKVEQAQHYEPGAWDEIIREWIADPERGENFNDPWHESKPGKINVTDVLIHGLGLRRSDMNSARAREVGRCLRQLGYRPVQERSGPHRGVRYFVREVEAK